MAIVKNETSFSREIRMNVALLKISGTIPPEDKTLLKMFFNYSLTIISFAFLVIYTSAYMYVFFIHAGYIETAIESFALIISFLCGLIRNSILYWSREKIGEILNTLEDLWKILNPKERKNITLYIKGTKNLTYFLLSQCGFTILLYAMVPLFINSSNGNLNSTRVLPFAFFADVHQSPYYEIVYIFQIASVVHVALTCVGVDMIGPLLITTVCGHLKVIQEQMRNIDSQGKMRSSDTTGESFSRENENGKRHDPLELVSSELRSCVNYHRKILTICTDIEQLTNIIFLTQLLGSTYILSAAGFKLSGGDQDRYKYFTQIMVGLVQLVICNWPPDTLLTESQAVADAVYSAPWYQWPKDVKKSVHIIILRAQKPIQLTAGKFVHLSLETFSAMLSSAVSFFTVLRSFN